MARGKKPVTLLEVRDLNVSFQTADGLVRAVRGVSFDVEPGRTLGIVGESGSGKTVLTQTLLGLTPGAQVSGSAMFEGANLLELSDDEFRKVRGARISVIFQDPLTSLHPLYKIGWQIAEMIRAHDRSVSKKEAMAAAVELLRRVGIPRPDTRVNDYPHQFSGGMRQRAMIAMALALEPKLIIADEPTTALDATVQAQILDLLLRLQQDSGTALIMITHDLGVVADIADDVMVMYAGRAAEKGPKRDVFYRPHHPYTTGLLESIPSSSASRDRLKPIPGQPPSLINLPGGCKFHPRCGYVLARCRVDEPALRPIDDGGAHTSACWLPVEAAGLSAEAEALRKEAVAGETQAPPADETAEAEAEAEAEEAEAAETDAVAAEAAERAAAETAVADGVARENDATADNKGSLA
jgi:peptide/nickel transport system ATP-binding protein